MNKNKDKDAPNLRDSYLLMDLFEDLKRLLVHLHTDKIDFLISEKRTEKFLKYRVSYQNDNLDYCEELLTYGLKFSAEKGGQDFYNNFDDTMAVIEKEKVKLKTFTSKTTFKEFMDQFDKIHQIAVIKHELTENLPVNSINADNSKKLKL